MKAYLLTTGSAFGLITAAHVWRGFVESHLVRDPWFLLTTVLAAGFCVWAWRLARSLTPSR